MRHYATPINLMHEIDTKQSILVSCREQIIRHYATPTNLMPRTGNQTLSNQY